MKHRRVLLAVFVLSLLLIFCAAPALSQSPDSPNPPQEIIFLQLDKPLRFLNRGGLPSDVPTGTYQVTAHPPDRLQLTSSLTKETHTLHATARTHEESLTIPYPFLLANADEQDHVHMVLLLPDGNALDAEGRFQGIHTRAVGDLPKLVFTPTQRYTGVVMQQGRVATDADWNEHDTNSATQTSDQRSNDSRSYGQVKVDEGRLQLGPDTKRALMRGCRACFRTP